VVALTPVLRVAARRERRPRMRTSEGRALRPDNGSPIPGGPHGRSRRALYAHAASREPIR
jgi:hypothetical protein